MGVKCWVLYGTEEREAEKVPVYDIDTNYESGEQVLRALIKIDGKKKWVPADNCVAVGKKTSLEDVFS